MKHNYLIGYNYLPLWIMFIIYSCLKKKAEQAVLSLNGYRLDNKTLVVKFANTATVSSVNRGIPSSNMLVIHYIFIYFNLS